MGLLLVIGLAFASPSCEAEAFRIAVEHPRVWRQAGSPTVACHVRQAAGTLSSYGQGTISVGDGGAYADLIAHELGHAWSRRLARVRDGVQRYARIRGFPSYYDRVGEIAEDYAETFAFNLGEYRQGAFSAVAPYRFQTVAGMPTLAQIAALRDARLLPRAH